MFTARKPYVALNDMFVSNLTLHTHIILQRVRVGVCINCQKNENIRVRCLILHVQWQIVFEGSSVCWCVDEMSRNSHDDEFWA
jgi:hypothetical protein